MQGLNKRFELSDYYADLDWWNIRKLQSIIALTWPRSSWKTFFLKKISEENNEEVSIVPQVTYRELRSDDSPRLIKTVSQDEYNSMKGEFYVSSWKYAILEKDVHRILDVGKVPICILWWKEILRARLLWQLWVFTVNITYPLDQNWRLSKDLRDFILAYRLSQRWWDKASQLRDIEAIEWYMSLFFNHHRFRPVFNVNYEVTRDSEIELETKIKSVIWKILGN